MPDFLSQLDKLLYFFHSIYLIVKIIPVEKSECRWMTDRAFSPGHLSLAMLYLLGKGV